MTFALFSSRAAVPEFYCPAGGQPRTAVLHRLLSARRPNRVFNPDAPDVARQIAAFQPEAIAASYSQLLQLHDQLGRDHLPTKAVIVFSTFSDSLRAEQRERLWELFEVPVFEQVLDSGGTLLASECEAHDALHVVSGFHAASACECGLAINELR